MGLIFMKKLCNDSTLVRTVFRMKFMLFVYLLLEVYQEYLSAKCMVVSTF